jgi:tetratricopeptide (TPR) repeat protein
MAYMLFRSDRFREAHELYARLASENETAAMRVNDGVAVSQLGDDEAASAAYRRALEIEPDHRLAQLYLGNALLRLGRRDQAVAAYSAFLDLDSRGESAERVRRILEQIAPEALPEKPSPLEPVPQPPAAGEAPGGSES